MLTRVNITVFWNTLAHMEAMTGEHMARAEKGRMLSPASRSILRLLLLTGQRRTEVTGAMKSELDLDEAEPVWTIPGKRTKNKKPNRVPLSPLALAVIAEARKLVGANEWLFPSPTGKGSMGAHAATKALDRARAAIGLEDFRIHDLRRTTATRMAELGISPHTISLILNHASARNGSGSRSLR